MRSEYEKEGRGGMVQKSLKVLSILRVSLFYNKEIQGPKNLYLTK